MAVVDGCVKYPDTYVEDYPLPDGTVCDGGPPVLLELRENIIDMTPGNEEIAGMDDVERCETQFELRVGCPSSCQEMPTSGIRCCTASNPSRLLSNKPCRRPVHVTRVELRRSARATAVHDCGSGTTPRPSASAQCPYGNLTQPERLTTAVPSSHVV